MSLIEITFEEYMLGRARIYREISELFSEPIKYGRVVFFKDTVKGFIPATEDEDIKMLLMNCLPLLEGWLSKYKDMHEHDKFNNERAREFTYLFRFGDDRVEDNASAALSKKKLMKRVQWEACKRFYTACGFKLKETAFKLEDSLEVQSLFMAHLIQETLNAESDSEVDETLRLQVEFMDEHMLNWIEKFSESLYSKAKDGSIYQILAYLPFILMRIDRENIAELL